MYKIYLLDTLLLLIPRCLLQRKRSTSIPRDFLCFVFLPCTRARHNLKLVGFNSRRINVITSCSLIPHWSWIASKGVRSYHAISMIRSSSRSLKLYSFFIIIVYFFYWIGYVVLKYVYFLGTPKVLFSCSIEYHLHAFDSHLELQLVWGNQLLE